MSGCSVRRFASFALLIVLGMFTSAHASKSTGESDSHPNICNVLLVDKSSVQIPWANQACKSTRIAWAKSHSPSTCKVLLAEGGSLSFSWRSLQCKNARKAYLSGEYTQEQEIHAVTPQSRSSLLASKASPPPQIGSVVGLVTWQYNNFVGTKGDVGATVALVPFNRKIEDADVESFDLALSLGLENKALASKYGTHFGKCDGVGAVNIDGVPEGKYFALIISQSTYRDYHSDLSKLDTDILQFLFSSSSALTQFVGSMPDHPTSILLHKWAVEMVTVRPDAVSHLSHDFGNSH